MNKNLKSVYHQVKQSGLIKNLFHYDSRLGISYSEFSKLSNYKIADINEMEVTFHDRKIQFSSPFWFLHSLTEIFVDEVYRFDKSNEPHLILDCGANIGLSAIYLKYIFPNAKIVSFEPDKNVFSQLKKNLGNFKLDDIELKNTAVWIENGSVNFEADQGVGGKINDKTATSQNVEAIRLKDYITDKNIFFLKMDIEGAEYKVLQDIENELKNIENVFIEFHAEIGEKNELVNILEIIQNAGFDYYIKDAWDNMKHPFTKRNSGGFHMQLNIFCYRTTQ